MRQLLTLIIVFSFTLNVFGATPRKHAKKPAVTKKKSTGDENGQLGTSFSFDAASIRGKYNMAGQGIASVENEKVMDDLLGLRKQFKDRQIEEAARE